MRSFRYVYHLLREFGARWGSYLLLVGAVSLLTSGVILPLLRWITAALLQRAHIPYLGVDNVLAVLTQHPFASLGLLGLLVLILLLVYLQFALLLGGIDNIRRRTGLRLRTIVMEGIRDLRHLSLASFGFFALYLLLIVPFAGIVIHSDLLSKVMIPTFVVDWIATKPWLAVLLLAFYLVVTVLGIRWIHVLPNTILHDQPLMVAARHSWQATRHHVWQYLWRVTLLTVLMAVLSYAWTSGLIALQTTLDQTRVAFPAAVTTLTLLLAGQELLAGMGSVLFLLFLVAPESPTADRVPSTLRPRHHWLRRALVLGVGGLIVAIMAAFGAVYMRGALTEQPLTISHRGVDAGNGVQNTLPALRKTAAERPDYVEMDLHETKDGQFIVLHDEDLRALAGIDRTPHSLTLAQLTQITVRENGHHAKLASFDDYLATAEALDQKLIVELKTTSADSPQMLAHFIQRYAQRLIAHGDRVHSLNYPLMVQLHRRVPALYVSFIMPYSLVAPQTDLSAYTVEYSTLDTSLVDAVHARHQGVWAWTVNDRDAMAAMVFADVDGIITDDLSTLKQVLAAQSDHPSYAQRLRIFAQTLSGLGEPVVSN
ncbi:glycerophosphoryl diester phosphodiesterase membrane domain-containing protein [Lacticaseibacillus absianus]|uniref:glycerophosphoryl diester phosphodiesterase membrane domain-containing protein n=1 Tax=Lacticaseibacillus absianus TaxID=2729623 RepID=UPI0015CD8FAA|nr:glycerophosphodiester phosphodiesterase [Lacticaseibacillus absianus]